jgi:hypothetical protein
MFDHPQNASVMPGALPATRDHLRHLWRIDDAARSGPIHINAQVIAHAMHQTGCAPRGRRWPLEILVKSDFIWGLIGHERVLWQSGGAVLDHPSFAKHKPKRL